MPHFMASDLGLHGLPVSHKKRTPRLYGLSKADIFVIFSDVSVLEHTTMVILTHAIHMEDM